MTPTLEAQGLSLGNRLQATDLQGQSGMVAIIGPNGAGKTSLLRALADIERDSGEVRVDGHDIAQAPPARRMRLLSFLPATRSLIWPIAARDVIELGLPSPNSSRLAELLEMLELRSLADRPVNQLSTGERSRVLLARALAAGPRLLLLDEPLSNLDPYWVLRMLEILKAEAEANGSIVLASLHDLNQMAAFDRVLLLDRGQVMADCGPEEMIGSATLAEAFRIERAGPGWRIREEA